MMATGKSGPWKTEPRVVLPHATRIRVRGAGRAGDRATWGHGTSTRSNRRSPPSPLHRTRQPTLPVHQLKEPLQESPGHGSHSPIPHGFFVHLHDGADLGGRTGEEELDERSPRLPENGRWPSPPPPRQESPTFLPLWGLVSTYPRTTPVGGPVTDMFPEATLFSQIAIEGLFVHLRPIL